MELKVDINPVDVNKAVAKAVLESSIGIHITNAVNKHVKSITEGYGNPIESAIKEIVAQIVREEVSKRDKEIRKIISDSLTDKTVKAVVDKFGEWLHKNSIIF